MALLANTINSLDLLNFSTTELPAFFVLTVAKRLHISATDALIFPAVLSPGNAYQQS
jgi:hypothetical protein